MATKHPFNEGWYLIYTRPRHEKKVHAGLAEKKISAFLPLQKTLRSWHDRKKLVEDPLFPSYVFVYLRDMQEYYMGMSLEGSLYYVRSGSEIARVSNEVVDNIKLLSAQSVEMELSTARFQPGDKVVIAEGALTGLSCELVEHGDKNKLLVRVDLLQRNILLAVPEEVIAPLPVGRFAPAAGQLRLS